MCNNYLVYFNNKHWVAKMIKAAMYTTIITLNKKGVSQRQIAKLTKANRKTVRKILGQYVKDNIEFPINYERKSKLNSWHDRIVSLMEHKLSYIRIYEELRDEGCQAGYSALTRYIRKHKIKDNSCIRFHTKPGEEAQVDFGYIGLQYNATGKKVKSYVFNMRLSYSRLDYYEVVFDQSVETWIRCHINAFNYFGGTPEVIKMDNLKAGVVNPIFYEPVFQKEYQRLAEHYYILLSPCRVYQPQEKGKVESGIKYVKNNFFAGRKFESYSELESSLARWQERANLRIHGTTKKVPNEIFKDEEEICLKELPVEQFDLSSWHNRKVARDCHITIENNYYSVPAKHVNSDVLVQLSPKIVQIFSMDNVLLARHVRLLSDKGVFTTNPSHYSKYKSYCPGFEKYNERYMKKMEQMGNNCKLFLEFLKKSRTKDWYRTAQGIVSLNKYYDKELIDKACLRGLHYGISSYSKIKNILSSNAVNLPLPEYDMGGVK